MIRKIHQNQAVIIFEFIPNFNLLLLGPISFLQRNILTKYRKFQVAAEMLDLKQQFGLLQSYLLLKTNDGNGDGEFCCQTT